jgi:hypothetical protein
MTTATDRYEENDMIDRRRLVRENNRYLHQAIDLVRKIGDELYCNNYNRRLQFLNLNDHQRYIIFFLERTTKFVQG